MNAQGFCYTAVDMGQPCDACFLENSELNSSVDFVKKVLVIHRGE